MHVNDIYILQMLENENEYIIHGLAYRDWAREIPNPQINVGQYGPAGGIDLNRAMSVVYNEVRCWPSKLEPECLSFACSMGSCITRHAVQ